MQTLGAGYAAPFRHHGGGATRILWQSECYRQSQGYRKEFENNYSAVGTGVSREQGAAPTARAPSERRAASAHLPPAPTSLLKSCELREGSIRCRRSSGSSWLRWAAPAGLKPRCSNQSAVRVVSSTRRRIPRAAASASAAGREGEHAARSAACAPPPPIATWRCGCDRREGLRAVADTSAAPAQERWPPCTRSSTPLHITRLDTRAGCRPCRRHGTRGARRTPPAQPPAPAAGGRAGAGAAGQAHGVRGHTMLQGAKPHRPVLRDRQTAATPMPLHAVTRWPAGTPRLPRRCAPGASWLRTPAPCSRARAP